MMNIILAIAFAVSNNLKDGFIFESDTDLQLINDNFHVNISKETGNITAIIFKNVNILSKPSSIHINNISIDQRIIRLVLKDYYPQYAKVNIEKECVDKFIEYEFIIDSLCLYWSIKIINRTNFTKEVSIDFSLPIVDSMTTLFYPTGNIRYIVNNFEKQIFCYRENGFIPAITLSDSQSNCALSVIVPLEIPKQRLIFSVDKENAIISFEDFCLKKNGKVNVTISIMPHKGDWRQGLNFLLDKYPEYFYPKVENVKIGEGWYSQGRSNDSEENIQKTAVKGVNWIEFHYYFPFLGSYIPKLQNWGLISNSDEVSLFNWEKGVGKNRNSYKNMKTMIDLWHKYGIQVYLYFQPFEAWHQYAEKYFPDDIARNKNGNPLPAWKFCNLMNPDPKGKWGKYIINQAKDILKKYPKIDGIFYDRMDYRNYDFAHNDGITMVDSQPAYMLGFALEKINEKIFDIFHKNGKGIWGNGPTSIEVCKNLDGIMVEGGLQNLYRLQYLCLVRPLIYLPYDKTPKKTEEKLKHSLVCGAFPSITYGGAECQKLDEKYRPLFELIKNRKWVLTSNPIEIPERFRANIFQTPDSNYVAVIISPEKSQLVPHPYEYNIPITINLPSVQEIKNVYLLSGDWTGVVNLNFKKNDDKINISIPRHLSSSVIYLSKNEKFKDVLTTIPVLIEEPISFAPIEDIFIQSISGDSVKFYFTNNTNQKLMFQLQVVFIKGDGWAKPPKKVILNNYETKIIPLIIGARNDGETKLKVLFNNKSIEKIFSVKASLVHEDDDLFYDDFKEGMKKWIINRGKWDVSNGIVQGSGPSHFAFIKNNNWQNYVFEVKTRIKGSDDPAVDWLKSYIFFRVQDEKNFYRFGIHGGYEMISLYKCVNGKWFELAKAPFSAQPNRWYAIKIGVKQDRIIGYLNGEVIIELRDNTFSHGGIGIGVLEDGMITDYRDIIVKKL